MTQKPTYEELEKRIKELERESIEHIQAQEALRKSEEQYRLLVNNLPSIVYKGFKDFTVEFFDNKVELLTGFTVDEFNSKTIKWSDLIVKEDVEVSKESFVRALKTDKSYVREYRIRTKSGNIHWIQERGQIVCNAKGEIEYVSGVFFDVTERKKADKALKESEERIDALLHSMPVGIIIIDAETYKIVDVNPMATLMIGAPIEQIVGYRCYDLICTAEKGRCPITDFGQYTDNSEHMLLDSNRERIPVFKTVIPIEIDDRKYFIECFVDMSKQKRAEQERIEKEKLKGVIEMAGAVCHEMNQPLMAISGYSELLLMDLSEDDPLREKLVKIIDKTDQIGKTTQKLMSITKYETKSYLKGKIIDIDKATK